MRFLEASIRGFGKFVDRRFRFAPGAQLFVGANEAGKSTLQRFLLAMLFGLKREDRKRRDYLAEYGLYKPWSGAAYAGRLVYDLNDGRRFEVQRVFERQDEEVRLLDAVSGRDLTAEFPLDHRKERPFMQSQLQLSRQLFEATTSLGQLAGRLSPDGAGALRERIQGLLDSGDESLSARGALERLQRLREQLGSERTPTRGLGRLLGQRRDLQRELQESRERHAEILELHAQRDAVAAAYGRYERAWEQRRRTELVRERQQLQQRLQRLEKLDEEIQQLAPRLQAYADVVELDVSAYPTAREHTAALAALTAETTARRGELEEARRSLEAWRSFEARLLQALGGLEPPGARELERQAERLRESIGRVREARRREEEEQRRNRAIVERLQHHRGRDWTDDAFMGQLASARRLLATDRSAAAAAEVTASRRALRRRALQAAGLVLVLAAAGAGLVARFWSAPWLPLGGAALVVVPLWVWSLRAVVAARDRARMAAVHAEQEAQRLREAREWLQEVLRRQDMQAPEELEEARREYESLRAQAERISAAGSRERLDLEAELADLAARLHAQVSRCDLAALASLRADPEAAAHGMPAFEADPPAAREAVADSEALQRLEADLRRLPWLRHACTWVERVRQVREARQRQVEQEAEALQQRQSRCAQAQAALEALLRRNGARDLEDFATRVRRHQERHALLALLRPLQREREGVLGGEPAEALRSRLHALRDTSTQAGLFEPQPRAGPESSTDVARQSLEELGRRKDALAAERAQLGERLAAREAEGRLPAEIELQTQEVERQIEAQQRRLAALQLTMETLQQVATTRHREAAPRMNVRVGQLFGRLCRTAHREVRLDEDLTPRVRMDEEGLFGAESLSGGAADQLYFALRVTAAEQLARGGEFLPLLLDDPFVQYDPDRLQAGLELVAELAREHQVLFFTSEPSQAQELLARLRTAGVEPALERL